MPIFKFKLIISIVFLALQGVCAGDDPQDNPPQGHRLPTGVATSFEHVPSPEEAAARLASLQAALAGHLVIDALLREPVDGRVGATNSGYSQSSVNPPFGAHPEGANDVCPGCGQRHGNSLPGGGIIFGVLVDGEIIPMGTLQMVGVNRQPPPSNSRHGVPPASAAQEEEEPENTPMDDASDGARTPSASESDDDEGKEDNK